MANKNLYVSEADEVFWERLEKLSTGSVSQVINGLVRGEVRRLEAMEENSKDIRRIVIEISYATGSGMYAGKRNIAFDGKWLVEDKCGFSIAQTKKGSLLVYYPNWEYGGNYHVFDDFEEIEAYYPDEEDYGFPEIPGEVKDELAEAIGVEYEEFLDI